jgi:hypothetical protein
VIPTVTGSGSGGAIHAAMRSPAAASDGPSSCSSWTAVGARGPNHCATRGSTWRANMTRISRGTPGSATNLLAPTANANPGAVPFSFGNRSAPAGSNA